LEENKKRPSRGFFIFYCIILFLFAAILIGFSYLSQSRVEKELSDKTQMAEGFASRLELANSKPAWADCMVHAGVSVERLCTLISLLGEKAISHIAAAQLASVARLTEQFLDEIAMKPRIKGRAYAAWLLKRMIISPRWAQQPLNQCYAACAQAFGVSPASVERCLRSAVESVFTQGSLSGIERFFGATIDPERGKPTNRAFLLQAAQQLQLIPLP